MNTYQRLWILLRNRVAQRAVSSEDCSYEREFLYGLLVEMAALEADAVLGEEEC